MGLQPRSFARFSRFLVCGTIGRASNVVFVNFSKFRFFGSEGSKMVDFGSFLGSHRPTVP